MVVGVAAVLTAAAWSVRIGVVPRTGLFHDDAWQVAAAIHSGPTRLIEVGGNQPGFTFGLMGLTRLLGSGSAVTTLPALVAGTIGPVVLFWFLRRLGHRTSVAAALAAALVVAELHVAYSGRVKPYVVEPLLVVALLVAVGQLATRRWRWPTALAWAVGASVVGSVSPFVVIVAVAGGVVLVVHPAGDRWWRVVGVGAHLTLVGAFLLSQQGRYHADRMHTFWRVREGAFIGLGEEPTPSVPDLPALAADTWRHLRQIVVLYPGGPEWFTTAATVVVLVGLVLLCRGRHRVVGRTLALALVLAVAGSMAGRVPFGALRTVGLRVSIWTVPLVAAGLAASLTATLAPLLRRARWRTVVDVGAYGLAAVLVLAGLSRPILYGDRGTAPATAFVEASRQDDDVVLLLYTAHFPFAVETDLPARVVGHAAAMNGLGLRIDDPATVLVPHGVPVDRKLAVAEEGVGDADRVLVVSASTGPTSPDPRSEVASQLRGAGFTEVDARRFGNSEVRIWERAEQA